MELTLLYHLATQPASDCTVRYIVSAEGKIRMTLSYTPVQGLTEMPEFGLSFQMDADFDQCTWYGMGPEETYCDRCTGAKLGVFASTTQEALSRYLRPQECGNRTGVRWAKVMRKDGTGLLFETRKPMDFSALPIHRMNWRTPDTALSCRVQAKPLCGPRCGRWGSAVTTPGVPLPMIRI